MNRTLLTALALTGALAATDTAAAAKPVLHKGKTDSGNAISFKRSGNTVTQLTTDVPTRCGIATHQRRGNPADERFWPSGSFRIGGTRTATDHDPQPNIGYQGVDKVQRVTLKRGRGGRISGDLVLDFSYQTLTTGMFGDHQLLTWACHGEEHFTVR